MVSEIFRTYVAGLLSPTSFFGLFLIIGVSLLWAKKIAQAKIILTSCMVMFLLMSTAPLKYTLYSMLESDPVKSTDYKYVVVLGGKIFPNDSHPTSSQITPSLMSRLAYGVALVKARPGSILVVTGNGAGDKPEAYLMEKYAMEMGVTREQIIIERESMNTSDHPVYLAKILKDEKFLIVTSAYHMKRALKSFKAHGLEGIPAPTDYQNKKDGPGLDSLIMRGENISALDRWMTEMYSTMWAMIRTLKE